MRQVKIEKIEKIEKMEKIEKIEKMEKIEKIEKIEKLRAKLEHGEEDDDRQTELTRLLEKEFGSIDRVLILDYWKYEFVLVVACGARRLRLKVGGDWSQVSVYSATSISWEEHVQAGIKEIQEISRDEENTDRWNLEDLTAKFGQPTEIQILDFREGVFELRVTTSLARVLRMKTGAGGGDLYRYNAQDLDWREHLRVGIQSLMVE